jgi:hypothetical protein
MRRYFIACLICFAVVNGAIVMGQALAQSGQASKQKERPQPPPMPRCPDLGVGAYAFVRELPGQPALGEHEIAVTYSVRNNGTAPYAAANAAAQSVALEYVSPAGATQLAIAPAITASGEGGGVVLGQGASERGMIRAALPPEARGRQLRLRLLYAGAGYGAPVNDCGLTNNSVNLMRPAQ